MPDGQIMTHGPSSTIHQYLDEGVKCVKTCGGGRSSTLSNHHGLQQRCQRSTSSRHVTWAVSHPCFRVLFCCCAPTQFNPVLWTTSCKCKSFTTAGIFRTLLSPLLSSQSVCCNFQHIRTTASLFGFSWQHCKQERQSLQISFACLISNRLISSAQRCQ